MPPAPNQTAVEKAISLHQSGQLDQADKLYTRILKTKPNHTEALHMRGVLKLQQGEYQLAEHLIRKALKQSKTDPWIYFHLAEVLASTKQHERAARYFTKALDFGAKEADVYYMFGNSLYELKRLPEAIHNYESALKLQPRDDECRINLANAYEANGDLAQAIGCIEPLASKTDASVQLKLQLAEMLLEDRRALKAQDVVLQIQQAELTNIEQILSTAKHMHSQYRSDSTHHLVNLILPHIDSISSQQFDITVGLLNELGRYAESRQLLDSLSDTDERSAWSWFQQGLSAQIAGDFELAATSHKSAMQVDGTLGSAAYSLASNGKTDVSLELLDDWITKKDNKSLTTAQQAQFAFAVARVYDKREEYELAFEYYMQANTLTNSSQPFNIDSWNETIENIIDTFSAEFFAEQTEKMKLSALADKDAGSHLHFIVGMPRSGSTLLEQTLKSEVGITGLGEHHALRAIVADVPEVTGFNRKAPHAALDLTVEHIAQFRQRYLASLTNASIKSDNINKHSQTLYVDKMLGNFLRLGILALMFPKARVLHSCRNPMATGVSCFTNAFGSGLKFTYDLNSMGRAWQSYSKLMQHWHDVLPMNMYDVHYENLVSEPEPYMQTIREFLELADEDATANSDSQAAATEDHISTASFWQARQPISTSSVEAWKRFDAYLDPLREGLAYKQP